MKYYLKYTLIFILSLSCSSCIKEDFSNCPNWGKYRVAFYDNSNVECNTINYITLLYTGVDSLQTPLLKQYKHTSDSLLIDLSGILRLFPGKYHFKALLYSKKALLNNIVQMKNGQRYLYASTINHIKKLPENRVGLHFKLANSMIIAKCTLEKNLDNLKISQVEISPPQEKHSLLNLTNGKCNYEQCFTSFFEHTLYNQNSNEWFYYCNPTKAGNYLSFKITVSDTTSKTNKTLITKVFLETGLEQGRVNKFNLNVTPNQVEFLSSTIIDWTDYEHYQEIIL